MKKIADKSIENSSGNYIGNYLRAAFDCGNIDLGCSEFCESGCPFTAKKVHGGIW